MNEEQLIELVQSQLPQDLTEEQLTLLRKRMRESDSLRETLMDELRLEQGIATRLAPQSDNVFEFIEQIERMAQSRSRTRWMWLSAIVVLMLGSSIGMALLFLPPRPAEPLDPNKNALAQNDKKNDDAGKADDTGDAAKQDAAKKNGGNVNAGTGGQDGNTPGGAEDGQGGGDGADKPDAPPDIIPAARPVEPTWRLFDDPAAMGDQRWFNQAKSLVAPVGASQYREREQSGRNYYELNGRYALVPPNQNGRTLRLRLHDLRRLSLSFWRGNEGVMIERDGANRLVGFRVKRPARAEVLDPQTALPEGLPREFNRQRMIKRVDRQIDFNWSSRPSPEIPREQLAVYWTGKLVVPKQGKYKIIAGSDDGIQVWINGERVIDAWQDRAYAEDTAELRLKKRGEHDIAIAYYQGSGDAQIRLQWEGKDIKRQVIPASNLRTTVNGQGVPGLTGHYVFGDQAKDDLLVERRRMDDDGRMLHIFRDGAFDLRYENGHVVIARGAEPLVSVPMKGPPTEVTMNTQATLRLAEVLYLAPLQSDARKPAPALAADADAGGGDPAAPLQARTVTYRAADLDLQFENEHVAKFAKLTKHDDGSVTLERNSDNHHHIWAQHTLALKPGMTVTLKARSDTDGAGVFLGDPSHGGHVQHFRGTYDGQKVITRDPNNRDETKRRFEDGHTIENTYWVRVVYGADHMRMLTSDDGVHFGEFDYWYVDAKTRAKDGIRVGLCTDHREGARRVTLESVTVSYRNALTALANPKLVEAVPAVPAPPSDPRKKGSKVDFGELFEQWLEAKPEAVDARAWRRACYVAMATRPSPPTYRQNAALRLVLDAIEDDVPTDDVLAALQQLPRLYLFGWDYRHPLNFGTYGLFFDLLAQREWRAGRAKSLGQLMAAWYGMKPGRSGDRYNWHHTVPPVLARLYLYHLHDQRDWALLRVRAMQIAAMERSGYGWDERSRGGYDKVALAYWMQARAARYFKDGPQLADLPNARAWTHPLAVDTDRESLNTVAEFLAAVDTKAYNHACMILTRQSLPNGIAPVGPEGELFKSTRVLLRHKIDEDEQLRRTLQQGYGDVGLVRVRTALQNNDIEAIEAVAMQFHRTAAEPRALRYLADRDLSMGNFFSAAARYARLSEMLPEDERPAMRAKRRLALALAGESDRLDDPEPGDEGAEGSGGESGEDAAPGTPSTLTEPIAFGPHKLTPQAFDSLLSTLRESRGRRDITKEQIPEPAPAAAKQFDLKRGGDLDFSKYRDYRFRMHTPRVASTIAMWRNQPRLIVHRHSRLDAIDASSGRNIWRKQTRRDERRAPGVRPPMPLVLGERVIVPLRNGEEWDLHAFELDNGKEIWRRNLGDEIVGDPIVIGPWLYVIGIHHKLGDYGDVTLHRVSPSSGEVVMSATVVRVRLDDAIHRVGKPVLIGETLLFRCANALICTDLLGETRWVRKLMDVPLDADPLLTTDRWLGDLVPHRGRVIVSTPGSPYLHCIDARTGATVWSYLQPQLQRLIGKVGGRLMLVAAGRLEALDPATGKQLWSRPITALPDAVIPAERGRLLLLTLDEVDSKRRTTTALVARFKDYGKRADTQTIRTDWRGIREAKWVLAADGSEVHTADLAELDKNLHDVQTAVANGKHIVLYGDMDYKSRRVRVYTLKAE